MIDVTDVDDLLDDLCAETDELDAVVARLDDARWSVPTPAEGWTVAHQIAHLAWTDEVALLSATEPARFGEVVAEATRDPAGFVDLAAQDGARHAPTALLDRWRRSRADLVDALRAVPAGRKLDWFGPPMGVASMATARIMETWAHGQDVVDALGVRRESTARLRHVAHLGVRTRDFAYAVHDRTPPDQPFRVELTAPDGACWTWGPEDAEQFVTGPALDFCLLVTQRRHRDDLGLDVVGPDAAYWITIAQAFAGLPSAGRKAGMPV